MVTTMFGPGGLRSPGPIATRCEASQPHQRSSVAALATSPPEATRSVQTAVQARVLVVAVSTLSGPVRLSGGPAKALLALAEAGKRGLSQCEAMTWTAQLGSTVRDLRKASIPVERQPHSRRTGSPTRYVLACQPVIVILQLLARGGAL